MYGFAEDGTKSDAGEDIHIARDVSMSGVGAEKMITYFP